MKTVLKIAALGAAVIASPAFAGVAITGEADGSASSYAAPAGSSAVITFDTGSWSTEAASKGFVATATGTARTATGDNANVDGTSNYFQAPQPTNNSPYFGVGANGTFQLLGSVAQQSVSVFVGSLDAYNVVTLLGASGNTLGSFSGTDMAGFVPPFPGTRASDTNRRITFSGTDGTSIYGIKFSNVDNKGSFEFDNIAFTAAVPEPATWAMMLLGFGMIGAASRYRSRKTTAVIA